MVLVKLQSDKKKFMKPQPIYYKGGSVFQPINNHQIYLRKEGGFINLSSLIDAGKSVANVVKDNKDLITSGIGAVKSISDTAHAIADTVKKSKELEELKTVQEIRKKKTKSKMKDIELTPEQMENLQKIGHGIVKF